jgi:tubulin-specific chaperone A
VKQQEKVARMRVEGADEHDIRKQVEVQGETEMMIPDTQRRLVKAVGDLKEFLATNAEEASLLGSVSLQTAKDTLASLGPGLDDGSADAGAAEDDAI